MITQKGAEVPVQVGSRHMDNTNDPTESTTVVDDTNVTRKPVKYDIIDLYSVGSESPEVPFMHGISIVGSKGDAVRVEALFDGGAMVAALCSSVFNKIKHRLYNWTPSTRRL
jgi:hypothetical protein